MITKICPQCNKTFIAKTSSQKLCSRQCAFLSMSRKVHVNCPICGKDMYIHKGDKKFCSLKCAGIGNHIAHIVMKTCPVCNKTFESKSKEQKFCSRECANIGQERPHYDISEEEKLKRSIKLKRQWQDDSFRQSVVDRMKSNNPVYMPGVVDKANATRHSNQSYSNNFKYGNGKISPYEQLVKDKLEPLGFVYNHAIATKLARDVYPDAHFSVNYKPDFVNLDTKLCIEIDGAGHSTRKEKAIDSKKEKCLNILGYTVIRFTHEDIDKGVFDKWLNSYQKDT